MKIQLSRKSRNLLRIGLLVNFGLLAVECQALGQNQLAVAVLTPFFYAYVGLLTWVFNHE